MTEHLRRPLSGGFPSSSSLRAGAGARAYGFIQTWMLYAMIAGGVLLALFFAIQAIENRGYARGKAETEAAYTKRDNQALRDALAKLKALQDQVREKEAAHQAELDKIAAQAAKEKADAETQHKRDIAAVRNRTLRLRDPGTPSTPDCDRGANSPTPTPTPGSDGPQGRELSVAAAEFLLGLVDEADRNTRQLTDAQKVILQQLKTCR